MARKSLAPEKDEMGGTLGRKTTDKTTCTTHSPPNDQVSLKGIRFAIRLDYLCCNVDNDLVRCTFKFLLEL
ncbi:hypothetical protein CEXT_747091 [Caerostris extrusa]|uniref:Uncharacterized protein n=1 Tax=Caerostris extrusa TaxID=172846 RepID=A0AAV4P2Z4_CAEEX|nr:hypothetical protein CEXT_747091 [Caerostris extrusa]